MPYAALLEQCMPLIKKEVNRYAPRTSENFIGRDDFLQIAKLTLFGICDDGVRVNTKHIRGKIRYELYKNLMKSRGVGLGYRAAQSTTDLPSIISLDYEDKDGNSLRGCIAQCSSSSNTEKEAYIRLFLRDLTDIERCVFYDRMSGLSMKDIAIDRGITLGECRRVIRRIQNKYKDYFEHADLEAE